MDKSEDFQQKNGRRVSPRIYLEDGLQGLRYVVRITAIYKPWSSAIWKGSHVARSVGDETITMVINHLQVMG